MGDLNLPVGLSRRAFLQQGSLVITAAAVHGKLAQAGPELSGPEPSGLKIGLLTDMHYADKPAAGNRYYRETLDKLAEAQQKFADEKIDLIVELGDLVDAADEVEVELGYLQRVNRAFRTICDDRHYVLGNHCVDTLTKAEFLGEVEQQDSYYAFDRGGVHFVVLDACFRSDGRPYGRRNAHWTDANFSEQELEWLADDLGKNKKPVVVFAHQRLDVSNNYGVKNAVLARKLFEDSGKVLAVFQGHSHRNDLNEIAGIPYCTLAAMIEGSGPTNSSYSILQIDPSGTLRLTGYRQQQAYAWPTS